MSERIRSGRTDPLRHSSRGNDPHRVEEDGPGGARSLWERIARAVFWGESRFFSREGRVVTTFPQVRVKTLRKVRRLPVTCPHRSTGGSSGWGWGRAA